MAYRPATLGAALILAIVAIAAAAGSMFPTPVRANEATPAPSCILSCEFGGAANCGELKHVAPKEGDTHEYGGGWHDVCYIGDCDAGFIGPDGSYVEAKHPSCTGISEDVDALLDAVEAGEVDGIEERVAKLGGHVQVVPERRAVQLLGCDGTVAAHIPTTESVLRALADD